MLPPGRYKNETIRHERHVHAEIVVVEVGKSDVASHVHRLENVFVR